MRGDATRITFVLSLTHQNRDRNATKRAAAPGSYLQCIGGGRRVPLKHCLLRTFVPLTLHKAAHSMDRNGQGELEETSQAGRSAVHNEPPMNPLGGRSLGSVHPNRKLHEFTRRRCRSSSILRSSILLSNILDNPFSRLRILSRNRRPNFARLGLGRKGQIRSILESDAARLSGLQNTVHPAV